MKNYFQKVGARRVIMMFVGNCILGLGISIFKLAGLGNDPFSGMNMAVAAVLAMSYPLFQILINLVYFVVEAALGRRYIGIGTIVNAVLLGYLVSFFYAVLSPLYVPQTLPMQILVLLAGMIITSLGISLYQTSDVGVAPYDALSLIMAERINKLPYFWCRVITDGCCALICFLSGGIIGLGTLVTAFGFGPFIHFFNVRVSEKLTGQK
ncbi:MAG: hypothetical protein Q4B22_02580 [Eubacteriales bacterium]|nr:hypothetical protein [Eubacteriales bacterium]